MDFIEAIGTWIDESTLRRVQKASYIRDMADECVEISTIEELSVFCRWEENGKPVESFLDIVPLNKADAEAIYTALVTSLKEKNLELGKVVGMGFDGAATFSGRKTGVQARIQKHAPHAIFIHCHCHMLQLACVQAANNTAGIQHIYIYSTALTTFWKYFHYSPKRTESLKEIQRALDFPEMKVLKPSDTCWLAHERCVKAVKESYISLVTTLEHNYETFHEPEALGLCKVLSKFSTFTSISSRLCPTNCCQAQSNPSKAKTLSLICLFCSRSCAKHIG